MNQGHLVIADLPETPICHLNPHAPSPAQGFIMLVTDEAVQGHLEHGDCLDHIGTKNRPRWSL